MQTSEHDPAGWAPVIAAWAPDVVALQEICVAEAVALADDLRRDHGLAYTAVPGPVRPAPAEDAVGVNAALRRPCHDTGPVTYGLAVLVRLSVTSAATTLYAPDHRDEQRGVERLTVAAPDGGSLTLYDTHLGLDGVAAGQIRDLAARAGGGSGPTVVLGDLNTPAGDGALAPLHAEFDEVDPDGRLPTSDNRTDVPGSPARAAIDHVLVRGLDPVGSAAAPWVPSSDHRPLVATLRLRRSAD